MLGTQSSVWVPSPPRPSDGNDWLTVPHLSPPANEQFGGPPVCADLGV